MREFRSLRNAAQYAFRCAMPAYVFHGPESGYVVAIGRDARELIADGHEPLSIGEMAWAAR